MSVTVAKTAGFCFGVERAVNQVYDQIKHGSGPIYTLGPIIHNEGVVRDLEEKGVKERREQQVAEKNESREAVPRTGGEANIAVKDAGKAERKEITGKEKKPSIHERLEINKRIIQEKQGKDEPEREADLSVRMV